MRQYLCGTLADDADPAGPACVAAAITTLDSATDALVDGRVEGLSRHAAPVVDQVAGLTFTGPSDLRRAASLHGLARSALLAVRQVIRTSWKPPGGRPAGYGPLVAVELASGSQDATMALLLTVGSLLRAMAVRAEWPERAAGADGTGIDDLSIKPRAPAAPEELAEFKDLWEQLLTPPEPSVAEPAPSPSHAGRAPDIELPGSPWASRAIVTSGRHQLCVLVSGSLGVGLEPVLNWFRAGGLASDHGLVASIPAPSPADFRTASRYETVLAGALTPDQRWLLEAGAGIRLPDGILDSLGPHSAVRVPAGTRARGAGSRPVRLVIPKTARQ